MGVTEICKRKLFPICIDRLCSVLLAPAFALLLSGCASLKEADAFYVPTTADLYPAKPADAQIPVLAKAPKKNFQVIGILEWEAPRRWQFVRRALERTARIHGADAILLQERRDFRETTLVDIPPTTKWVPVTRIVYVTSGSGQKKTTTATPVTEYYPVFQPGYLAENVQNWTAVRAEFIVFEGTKPIGILDENSPSKTEAR